MSTTNPTTTPTGSSSGTSTPAATSSQSNSDSATLYLFTFLATILILVLLSASLVLRSYVLRRRYRQRFQQALTDGLFPDFDRAVFNDAGQFDPLSGFRRPIRRLGPSPVLWDTWIHPADEVDTLSSITPVAVRCTSSLLPSTLVSSPELSTTPPGSPSSPRAQPRPSTFSQLRLPNPFSLSSRPSSPLPSQAHTPIGFPTLGSTRSPPPTVPTSPDPSTSTEKDAANLAVCVLVAMPAVSAPVHRPTPDAKGKGVDSLEFQAHRHSGDADLLLPASLHRSDARTPDSAVDEEGLPLLEFGVVEMKTGEWVWKS